MDWVFIGATAVIALLALGNWRAAIYACLVLDVVRDPVRKLSERQLSSTTVIVGIVWLAAMVGATTADSAELRLLVRRYPQLKTSLAALAIAIIPGMLVSIVCYNNGWILAAIGAASYSAPFIGIILGYLWPWKAGDVYRWMKVYVLLNSVFFIGSILEAGEFDFPGLGGMNMVWLRNYGHDFIKLICGFYRSPDVMGLHAAHAVMFAVLLAIRHRQRMGWLWLPAATWAAISLLLCGRRKMMVIPVIFLVTLVTLQAVFTGRTRIAITMAVLAAMCAGSLYFIGDVGLAENDYTHLASTIATDGAERAARSFTDIVFTTLRQSGWLGDGLGTVTQGRQYTGVVTQSKDWQEDGIGRLFKELGVPGVLSMMVSAVFLLRAVRFALDAIPSEHPCATLQFGVCGVIVANMASFSVSHQAYSGDPSTVLIVGFCLGIILGLPRTVRTTTVQNESQILNESALPDLRRSHLPMELQR